MMWRRSWFLFLFAPLTIAATGSFNVPPSNQRQDNGAPFDQTPDRVDYTRHAEATLKQWENELVHLKAERDSKPLHSEEHTRLADQVLRAEHYLGNAQDNFNQMTRATGSLWRSYQSSIDADFGALAKVRREGERLQPEKFTR